MWSQLASLASQVSETVAPVTQEFTEALREDDSSSAAEEVPEQSSSGAGWLSTVAGGVKGIQQALAESDDDEDQSSRSPEFLSSANLVDPFAEPEFHFKDEESANKKPPVARVPPATSLWGMVSSVKGALQEFQEALQEESDQEERASDILAVAETSNDRAEEEEEEIEAPEESLENRIDTLEPQNVEELESSSAIYETNQASNQEKAFDSSSFTSPAEHATLEISKNAPELEASDERPMRNVPTIEASTFEPELEDSNMDVGNETESGLEISNAENAENPASGFESGLEGSNMQIVTSKGLQLEDSFQVEEHPEPIDTMVTDSFKKDEEENEYTYTEDAKDTSSGNSSIVNVEVGEIMKSTETTNELGTATPEDFELVVNETPDMSKIDTGLADAQDATAKDGENAPVPSLLSSEINEPLAEENQTKGLGNESDPVSAQESTPNEDALALESVPVEVASSPFGEIVNKAQLESVQSTVAAPDSTSGLVSPRSASGNRRGRRGQQKRQSGEHQVLPTQQQQLQPPIISVEHDNPVQSAATSEKLTSPPNSRSQKKSRGRGNQKAGASPSVLSPSNLPQPNAAVSSSEASPSTNSSVDLHSTEVSASSTSKDAASIKGSVLQEIAEVPPPQGDSNTFVGDAAKEAMMTAEITKLKAELEAERSARVSGMEFSKAESIRAQQEFESLRKELEREKGLRQKGMDEAAQKEKAIQMALQEVQMKHSQAVGTVKNMTDRIKSLEGENQSAIETLQKTARTQMSEMEKNLARMVAEKANLQKELVASREALENAARSSDKQREINRTLTEKAMQNEQAQQQEIEKLAALLHEKDINITRSQESFKQQSQNLQSEVSRLESELAKFASLQQDLDFALAENATLREKAESLASKAELDLALQEVESLRSELTRRESVHHQRVQVLEAELEATKADVISLTTSSESAKSEVDKLRKALMRTTADLEKEESSHRQKISTMRAEMSRAKDEHEAELAKAAEKQDELRQEIGLLRDEIAVLKRSIVVASNDTAAVNAAIDPRVISNLVFAFVKRGRENGDNGRKEVVETMARMLEWTEAQRADVISSLTPSATASTSAVVARGIDLLLSSSSSSNAAESKSEPNRKKSVLTTEVAAKLLERESFEDVFFKEFLAKESSGASSSRRGSLTKPAGDMQPKTPLSSRALNRSDTASPLPVSSPTNENAKSVSQKLSEETVPSVPASPTAGKQEG